MRKGYFYKLGGGPIHYGWNRRYFVLEKDTPKLSYYLVEEEKSTRHSLSLQSLYVSSIAPYRDKSYTFMITLSIPKYSNYLFGFDYLDECESWHSSFCELLPTYPALSSTRSLPNERKSITYDRSFMMSQRDKISSEKLICSQDIILVDEINKLTLGQKDKWELIMFKNGIKYSGILNNLPLIGIHKDKFLSKLITALIVTVAIFACKYILSPLMGKIVFAICIFAVVKSAVDLIFLNPPYKMLKAAAIIESDASLIVEVLMKDDCKNYSHITNKSDIVSEDMSSITILESVNLKDQYCRTAEYQLQYTLKVTQYKGVYYISRIHTLDYSSKQFHRKLSNFTEYYVISQFDDKCMVFFITSVLDATRLQELNGLKYFVYKKALIRKDRQNIKKRISSSTTLFTTPYKE